MSRDTDIRPVRTTLYFLPVQTRVPLKFGPETLESVTCARVKMDVVAADGRTAAGWGETPLSVQWVWPSSISYAERHDALKAFTIRLANAWAEFDEAGDPVQVGHRFQLQRLEVLLKHFNVVDRADSAAMPWLAALVCCSLFDIALHDAFGNLVGLPVYETYRSNFLNEDLSAYLEADDNGPSFAGQYPSDYLVFPRPDSLPAWHLVGGLDPVTGDDLSGDEPHDAYPVLLDDWIRTDGLRCLKIKLRGNDSAWDYQRVVRVGKVALNLGVEYLTTDFNCTVEDPVYVNTILDELLTNHSDIYDAILYVEQPFPHDLEANRIDVHSVSERKPLYMDESAHDWQIVRLGRSLGWTGVALKTCKTQTGAILSLCWAKAHGMELMVQDLTNPMLAQIPHVLLAAHAGTIQGVETNSMQFYPEASAAEAKVHPGIYSRNDGKVDLGSIQGSGFGYRLDEIERELPEPATICETSVDL
ncbi:MAG: enolase C-terminal domain-like protein [Candidatus Hydrogenedentota bacterium]